VLSFNLAHNIWK